MLPVFYLFSDLHLEFNDDFTLPQPTNKDNINICLLLGDIGHPTKDHYRNILKQAKSSYHHVIIIPGNHEYYARDKDDLPIVYDVIRSQARTIAEEESCIFLDRDCYSLYFDDDKVKITFLGCTLWSKIGDRDKGINDFNRIYLGEGDFLTPKLYAKWHQRDVEWLSKELNHHRDEMVIVLTHHLPTKKVIHPTYRDHHLNKFFASDLEKYFSDNILLWACGHSHKQYMSQVNKTWCALNPLGYPGENNTLTPLSFSFFKGNFMKLIPHNNDFLEKINEHQDSPQE